MIVRITHLYGKYTKWYLTYISPICELGTTFFINLYSTDLKKKLKTKKY